jgi:cell wall assembly regulator SMI1
MSLVTQSCDRLLVCIQEHFPWDAERFQPGLSREEIEKKAGELPFPLPEEIYELYQWRNGNPSGNLFIPGKLAGCLNYFWFMLSLEEAVNTYFLHRDADSLRKKEDEGVVWDQHWFPVFKSLHEGLFHVVEIGKETSRVFFLDPTTEGDHQELCDNLAEFLVIEADFFEEQSEEQPWLY